MRTRPGHWLYSLPLRFRSLWQRSRVEEELAAELQYHLDQRIELEMQRGQSPEEARRIAILAMEGLEQKKEECRDARRVNLVDNLARDLRYAVRMLAKSPVFTTVAILSLALGIGANTAIFSLIDTLMLRPLPVPHPEELVQLQMQGRKQNPSLFLTHPMFEQIRRQSRVFTGIFAWTDHRFQWRTNSGVLHVNGVLAGGDYFAALGVAPAIGRTFDARDDKAGGGGNGPTAVISNAFWERRYQKSPAAVGSTLALDGVDFTIIGVMPKSFFGADVSTRPEIWVPLGFAPRIVDSACFDSASCWWLLTMARLSPGVSLVKAQAQLKTASPAIFAGSAPTTWDKASTDEFKQSFLEAVPGASGWNMLRMRFTNPLWILMTLVGLVLLIACANLANLMLARSSARQREIAVRLALGAGRLRIIRQLLTESLLLSFLGGAAGLAFAFAASRLLVNILTSQDGDNLRLELALDWRILAFTFLVALVAGLLFGLAPALRATRQGISGSLKEHATAVRGDGGSRFRSGRHILIAQTALSVLLVCGAGLFGGSLWRLWTLNPGFNPHHLFTIRIDTTPRALKGEHLLPLYHQLLAEANTIPGVEAASLMWFTPLTGAAWNQKLSVPGQADLTESQSLTYINLAGPQFFEAMGTPLLAGRGFNDHDTPSSARVGIINELAARRFFGDRDPIGSQIKLEKTPITIIGVAGNSKYLDLRQEIPPELYIPYTQNVTDVAERNVPPLTFVIRSKQKGASIQAAFTKILHRIAPDVAILTAHSMDEQVAESLASERLMASLSLFFGVLALLLTSIGLYGVLAYTVTRRTTEIGLRMALGAQRRDVLLLVARESVVQVILGVVIGIAAVLATSHLVASMLYGVRPNDLGTLSFAVMVLLLVAGLAAYLPARRASRLEPLAALREE